MKARILQHHAHSSPLALCAICSVAGTVQRHFRPTSVHAQAQYRAALALEALGRIDEAVPHAEQAATMQSSAEVSALADQLRGLGVSGSTRTRPSQSDRTSSTAVTNAGASRDDKFLRSAAPKLASAPVAAASHAAPFPETQLA